VVRRAPGAGRLKVRVASVGKDRSGLFEPAVREYGSRLGHYARFELVELPGSRKRTSEEAQAEEAERLLALAAPRDEVVALDERGLALDTRELASRLGRAQSGARDLLFLVGGDEGLDASVRARAKWVLSLSKLTLPHRLARLVLVEQLYRAFSVLRGEPYHK
jgi:23S rRNA (pseudouridine1915-N3)-methyltransferase